MEKKDHDGAPQTMDDYFQLLAADDEDLEQEVKDYESIELTFDDYEADPADVIDDAVDDDESDM